MDQDHKETTVLCPKGHENTQGLRECVECGLPLIECDLEMKFLIRRFTDKSSYVVPYIESSFVGIGTMGNQVITDLYGVFGDEVIGVSFLNIDSMVNGNTIPEINTKGVRFYQHIISEAAVGGMIYCGLGERAASQDAQLQSYLHMSGIRREDPGQTIFISNAVGGGTGSGVGPIMVNLSKSCNPRASVVAVTVIPSTSEADHIHLNAFCGLAKSIRFDGDINADMVLLVNYDKLRHLRGVGRSGEELKADKVITYMLRLFALNLYQSGIIRMCRISRGTKIQVFVPCLAIGRSIEIFGDLANILESAGAYPMADIKFENVMSSYLILRVPRTLSADFTEEIVSEAFEKWNRKHVPSISSSLVQILKTDERSDRIDVCILLGGDDLSNSITDTIGGYRRFKASLSNEAQWDEYGLSTEASNEAEQIIDAYDKNMQVLRSSKTGS